MFLKLTLWGYGLQSPLNVRDHFHRRDNLSSITQRDGFFDLNILIMNNRDKKMLLVDLIPTCGQETSNEN